MIAREQVVVVHPSGIMMPVPVVAYPDQTPVVDWNSLYSECEEMILRPSSMNAFVTAMFLVDAITERGGFVSKLILPSIPGARQDRLNPSGDYLFTVKSVAKMVNERGFDEVVTLDPHSNVGPALIDRCRVVHLDTIFNEFYTDSYGKKYPPKWDAVIAPDAGAANRAFLAAQALGIPMLQAGKHRDVTTGKLSGFIPPKTVHSGKYLIVDDICDAGGTFLGLAEAIGESMFCEIDLWATHGIFTKTTEPLLDVFDNVYTTDSTVYDHTGAKTIEIIERLRSS